MSAERIPLAEQLDEIRAEYTRRCQAYPLLVARGQMRDTAAELKIERMGAAHNTLAWLLRHAEEIRDWVNYAKDTSPAEHVADVLADLPVDIDPGNAVEESAEELTGDYA